MMAVMARMAQMAVVLDPLGSMAKEPLLEDQDGLVMVEIMHTMVGLVSVMVEQGH